MKRPQTKFQAHTMGESQVIRSKKSQNLALGQTFLQHSYFYLHRLFTETATTDVDMLFKLSCNSVIATKTALSFSAV